MTTLFLGTRRTGPIVLALLTACSPRSRPATPEAVAAHVTAARLAAGEDHVPLFLRLCTQSAGADAIGPDPRPSVPDSLPAASADGPGWYAEPVRVFDNLYWVGQTRYSAWAVDTSEGIVVVDPLFDYSVVAEVEEGLAKMGLDPERIRYVIVSHGHLDHAGGARHLQERFGARVILAPEDWDLLERAGGDWPKPERDIEAHDGFELRLGGTTLLLYAMPGHTPGTISTLIPVTDRGTPHLAALVGGTAFNFMGRGEDERWFREYVASAERFAEIARRAGADVLLSNHPQYDGSTVLLPQLARRGPNDPHPYVIGGERLARYFAVATECATAGLAGLKP